MLAAYLFFTVVFFFWPQSLSVVGVFSPAWFYALFFLGILGIIPKTNSLTFNKWKKKKKKKKKIGSSCNWPATGKCLPRALESCLAEAASALLRKKTTPPLTQFRGSWERKESGGGSSERGEIDKRGKESTTLPPIHIVLTSCMCPCLCWKNIPPSFFLALCPPIPAHSGEWWAKFNQCVPTPPPPTHVRTWIDMTNIFILAFNYHASSQSPAENLSVIGRGWGAHLTSFPTLPAVLVSSRADRSLPHTCIGSWK